ncbi:SH3 domain-containing protein [Metabacillus fastidiosus]|uniref:SH3 domain-containing protein n=1 Tax=Metabacillus fastidiosus TaxID=1458 RepID=UPI003D26F409
MKKKNLAIVSSVFTAGILVGSLTPSTIGSAAGNVVLASVEWVTSQINPLKTKVDRLETEVKALRQALENGEAVSPLPGQVYVNTASATVHRGASKSERVYATFTKGQTLKVIEEHLSSDGTWYRVEYAADKYGWIYSGDVSKTAVTAPTSFTAKSTATVHRSAVSSERVVATLKSGTTVKYISSFTNKQNELWYNVQLSNGVKGWVQAAHGEVK